MHIKYRELPIPTEWTKEKIGNRLMLNYGRSHAGIKTEDGTIPIFGTGGLMGYGNRALTDGDSVLIGRKGTLGNPLYIGQPFWPVDTTYFTSDFDGSMKWIYYLVQTIDLQSLNEATGVPSLSRQTLYNVEVLFPPHAEQTTIAGILTTVDQAIEQTEALIAKQRRIRAGLLHDLLTRGIDENGQLRDPATHRFKQSPVGLVPEEWEVTQLAQLAEVDRGQFKHRPRNEPVFYGGEFPFIQTGDVTENIGRVLWTFSQTLSKKGATVSKEFPAGTIAVTIAANIADTAILGVPMYFPDSIVGVIPRKKQATRFLEMCIRDRKRAFDSLAPQSAQKNINLQDLRPMLIPLPDLEEQEVIGKTYEAFDDRVILEESSLAKFYHLKTGLMQDLLSGRVSVARFVASKEQQLA